MLHEEQQHRFRSRDNEQFADSLDVTHSINDNWAVVAAFYAALHYIEAYFTRLGKKCINHDDRAEKIKADLKLRRAYVHYSFLYSLSIEARYKLTTLTQDSYKKRAKPQLDTLKGFVDGILGRLLSR